jgi:hypothetical protein
MRLLFRMMLMMMMEKVDRHERQAKTDGQDLHLSRRFNGDEEI